MNLRKSQYDFVFLSFKIFNQYSDAEVNGKILRFDFLSKQLLEMGM